MIEDRIQGFIDYVKLLEGKERKEAALYLEHLFQAFGHKGIIESNASLEHPIKIDDTTKFCDLIWPGKVLIEMKTRGTNLNRYFPQAKTYWDNLYTDKTEYVILCNFDEFWIYNWNLQREPLETIEISNLAKQWRAMAFLCLERIEPIFNNNLVEVTEEGAKKIADFYLSLLDRGITQEDAQRFALQCLVCLFAEDVGLFPRTGYFYEVISDSIKIQSNYELFKGLFEQMNSERPANKGRYLNVHYFNGGIFDNIDPIELTVNEMENLRDLSEFDWSAVQPSIFGSIFEMCISKEERHKSGAHFTYPSDIMRIIEPTLLRPWRERINKANSLGKLNKIHKELSEFKILDPACGSGNFLYIAFREFKHLELFLLSRMVNEYKSVDLSQIKSTIRSRNFFGIDTNTLGIELAKVTLSMAKLFAANEFNNFTNQYRFFESYEDPLPFENLNHNLIVGDALFIDWPEVNAIIGNPPYQSKNKMQEEFGLEYVNDVRNRYPDVPGLVDYCVYWFRIAHDSLPPDGRAGLVGTNTIRETYSRIGGLDYIIDNGGTITEAVSTMPWSGSAVLHVSIVNWIKGEYPHPKRLLFQRGETKNTPWEEHIIEYISSSLSFEFDVSKAKQLEINRKRKTCFQGQTHGHKMFLTSPIEYEDVITKNPCEERILFPYLIADDLLSTEDSQPTRYIIDFQPFDLNEASEYRHSFSRIKEFVLPSRIEALERENKRNEKARSKNPNARINRHHYNFHRHWWRLSYERRDLINELELLSRYIVCGRVTRRPIFEFISTQIRPNDALSVFTFEDNYSFGILQSIVHWRWFKARCSTLKDDFRYTSTTVFNSFPWPQWSLLDNEDESQAIELVNNIASASIQLLEVRERYRVDNHLSLRDMYRNLELPGENSLRKAHQELDNAVVLAYKHTCPEDIFSDDTLEMIYRLNDYCSGLDKSVSLTPPGLPEFGKKESETLDSLFSSQMVSLI